MISEGVLSHCSVQELLSLVVVGLICICHRVAPLSVQCPEASSLTVASGFSRVAAESSSVNCGRGLRAPLELQWCLLSGCDGEASAGISSLSLGVPHPFNELLLWL